MIAMIRNPLLSLSMRLARFASEVRPDCLWPILLPTPFEPHRDVAWFQAAAMTRVSIDDDSLSFARISNRVEQTEQLGHPQQRGDDVFQHDVGKSLASTTAITTESKSGNVSTITKS